MGYPRARFKNKIIEFFLLRDSCSKIQEQDHRILFTARQLHLSNGAFVSPIEAREDSAHKKIIDSPIKGQFFQGRKTDLRFLTQVIFVPWIKLKF